MRMKLPFQIEFPHLILAIAAIIIVVTAATLLSSDEEKDTTPPKLSIDQKIYVTDGDETITINATFSDNVKVTVAKIFYKKITDQDFKSGSIINGSYELYIPYDEGIDWEFYVIVNDAAGNGPVGDPSIDGSDTYEIIVVDRNDNDNSNNETYNRFVFVEECSAVACSNCPAVSDSIHELSEEGINFYYVTLISDSKSETETKPEKRMEEYNVTAYPTVLIDGGYFAYQGAKKENVYETAIRASLERDVPDIEVFLEAENKSSGITIDVTIINNQDSSYSGNLKVYLAEIVSSTLQDSHGDPYSHAFLEFAINQDITISAKSNITKSKSYDKGTFDEENLLVYAVVFSDEKHEKFLDDDKEIAFDAYYVDGCAGTQVVEGGNLPPSVAIITPAPGIIYFLGNEKEIKFGNFSLHPQKTVIIGKMTFTFEASDTETSISYVELYIDDVLVKNFTKEPYKYDYKNTKFFKWQHTIKVIAYDSEGKTASAERDIFAITRIN